MIIKIGEILYEMKVAKGKEEEIIQVMKGIKEFFEILCFNVEYDLEEGESLSGEIYSYKMHSIKRLNYYKNVLNKLGYEVEFEEKKELRVVEV